MKNGLLGRVSKKNRVDFFLVLIASVLTLLYNRSVFYVGNSGDILSYLYYIFKYIPIMIVTAVSGIIPAMGTVLIVFVYRCFMSNGFSYLTFIYLAVACMVDQFTVKGCFKKWYKTILASCVIQILVGDIWGTVLVLLGGRPVSSINLGNFWKFFFAEAPGCLLGCFFIYFLFKFLPDNKKLILGNGKYYVDMSLLDEDDRYIVGGKSKLGKVVTGIIVFEAFVLGISAEISANTLIPNINSTSIEAGNENGEWVKAENAEMLEGIVSNALITENDKAADESYERTFNKTQYSAKLAMLISIIVIPLAVFVNRYAQRRIAEPIRNLSKAVSDIYNSEETDIGKKVSDIHKMSIYTDDEIEELYHAVDLTLYRLIEYIDLVRSRQIIEDQLQTEKSANEAKSRFLSNISHEIRTPINAILGFDEMILRECSDKEILGYALDIKNSGKTLLALINDILDFSRIEAGRMEIIPVEYELSSLINDVANMAILRAKDKGLEFKINVSEDIPHILFGDEIRIKQCIMNIMTNAIKYTEKGSVTFDVDYENYVSEFPEEQFDEKIILKVRIKDTGIGIKEEDMSKLTDAFERLDEKRNRAIEGTGLGINIVSSLLLMMGSKLEAKSTYGVGSEFYFNLVQSVVDREPIGQLTKTYKENALDMLSYKESFHAPSAAILVVDDIKTNLTVIEGLLKKTLVKVDTATSAKKALELVKKNRYDLIFLDHRMPDMDGIQALHEMENMEDNLSKNAPVVALTANAISGSREMYLKEGFVNYLSKPVNPAKLEEMILSYLPEYKVSKPGDPGYESGQNEKDDREKDAMADLLKARCVDINAAIARCGSPSVARDVMKDFRLTIKERADMIEESVKSGDVKNFTIYVHGLKSSAKAIGAISLSDKAEFLERCGMANNMEKILENYGDLVDEYRSYYSKLSFGAEDEETDKPLIDPKELEGAFLSIKEFVSGSYFDSADDIMKMLDEYSIPKEQKEKYKEVKRLLAAVDRDGLLKIL